MKTYTNKSNILLLCLAALFVGFFSACDDTVGGETTPGFPTETLEVSAVPGDSIDVAFNVGYSWKINSDKDWCRVNGEDKSFGGKAGEHTLTFVVSDLGNLFVDDVAQITLHMNEESRVIARITRSATMKYTMEVSDAERVYVEGESILIGVMGTKELTLAPNFDIDQLEYDYPTWIEVQRDGKTFTLSVIEDSLRYNINREGDSLRFFKDSTFYSCYHVQNKGQEILVETQWGVKVAFDGKTYHDAVVGEDCEAPMTLTVDALRGYELMCASYDNKVGCTLMNVEESWIDVEDDREGNLKVSFEANGDNERSLYLFALPQSLVRRLDPDSPHYRENLSAELLEVDSLLEIKAETEQYVVAKFVQEPDPENSIKVLKKGEEVIEVVKETDQEWLDMAAAMGVAEGKVFRCGMKLGYFYQIKPLIHCSIWDVNRDAGDRIEVYGKSGHKYESGTDYKEEHMMMEETEGDYMLVQLSQMKSTVKEDFIVYFINDDTEYMKALVVTLL